jgi:drug/metabolite transporter (DMT)-like permease
MIDRFDWSRLGVAGQFLLLAGAWGSSFLFIKIGLAGLSPFQVVWARMVFGALALGLLVALTRQSLPRDPRVWGHLTVVVLLLCIVPFLLFAWAEQHISSGLASIFNATTPLLTMLVGALVLTSERLTPPRVLGLGLGFTGVLCIIGVWRGVGPGGSLAAQLACLAATTCYALAFVYLRRFIAHRGIPARALAFVQVFIGAIIMVLTTPWLAAGPIRLNPAIVVSMVLLGAAGSGLAYVWNNNIVSAWGAANAAAVTYLSPVVGVVLGVLVLGEPVTWNQPVGAALIILGLLAAHGRLTPHRMSSSGGEPVPHGARTTSW